MRKRAILLAALCAACACGRRPDPLPGLPRVFLWAWEHPEHLTFLDPHKVGVAFLARSVNWRGGAITSAPRLQSLEVPAGTAMIAVVRLESQAPPLPDAKLVVAEVLKAAGLPRVRALEIDFDARASERTWYTEFLNGLRARLQPSMPLTITALASWCEADPWIRSLPVVDAVPMMFRMGAADPRDVREYSLDVCRNSVGVSTDEIAPVVPRGRRLFIFHPGPWTAEAYRGAMQLARRLQ
ncbi:MAG TPA: DUF3142 domain-containing protein [Candidatus Sulfopaludibacter sp.]|jgi:hypothetical protein|nr:DUF3142 domain-containing protein [Candidatus Sulfopaludibacter sp.]